MSLPVVVSVIGNVLRQRARFKRQILASVRMSVMNIGQRNPNDLCYATTMRFNYSATKRHKLKRSLFDFEFDSVHSSNNLQTNFFRCYSMNNSESDKEHSFVTEGKTEKLLDNQGPVRMSISEDGELRVHIDESLLQGLNLKDDNINTNMNKVIDNIETDNTGSKKVKLESELMVLIGQDRIESVVELLQVSVEERENNPSIVINLLKKLSKHGAVENILKLQHFILNKRLCKEIHFMQNLIHAYHESGQIQDAVVYLRNLCIKSQDYSEVQACFISFTTMILKRYPQFKNDVVSIVNNFKIPEKFPELEKDLWKCFILSENFSEAEKYLKENTDIKTELPALVSELYTAVKNVNEITDEEKVWKYLLISGEELRLTNSSLLGIYEKYLQSLYKKEKYRQVVLNLDTAKRNGKKIRKSIFDGFRHMEPFLSRTEKDMLTELKKWYQEP